MKLSEPIDISERSTKIGTGPKISVITPVYNGALFLEKAINSVLEQSYPAYEIIVIDDGSTDGSPVILDRYEDKIIRKRIPNSGISKARNTGISLVTGDYVAFIDQDDIWFKNKLQRHAEAITKYPGVGFFCSDFITRKGPNARLFKHFSSLVNPYPVNFDQPLETDPFELLLREHFVGGPSAVVIQKDLMDRVGFFNTKYVYTQDYDYFMRCALVTDFVILSEPLLYKRTHKDNFSSDAVRMYTEHRQLLKDTAAVRKRDIKQRNLWPVYQISLADIDYMLGDANFESGHWVKAFHCYCKAYFSRPTPPNAVKFCYKTLKKSLRVLVSLFKGSKLS